MGADNVRGGAWATLDLNPSALPRICVIVKTLARTLFITKDKRELFIWWVFPLKTSTNDRYKVVVGT